MSSNNAFKNQRIQVGELLSARGYLHRQVWTHPPVGTATGIMPSIMSASDMLSANFYKFTVTSASATVAGTYPNNGVTFTTLATISSATTLYMLSAGGAPAVSGTLTQASGSGDATITYSAAAVGFTKPTFPRCVSVTSTLDDHDAAGNVTIKGTDIRGNAVTDVIVLNGSTAANGVVAFGKITEVDLSAATAIDGTAGVEVGTSAYLGLDRICTGNEVLLGTAAGTVEGTLPVITTDTTIGKNVVLFTTALDVTKTFVCNYITTEVTGDPHLTA